MACPRAELALARQGKAFTTSSSSDTRIWVPVRGAVGRHRRVGLGSRTSSSGPACWAPGPCWPVSLSACLLLALLLSDRLGRSLVLSIENLDSVTRRLSEGELERTGEAGRTRSRSRTWAAP